MTESAAAAGDEYNTRSILLTEGVATLIAGLSGGPLESGGLFFPWATETRIPWLLGGGYGLLAAIVVGLAGRAEVRREEE